MKYYRLALLLLLGFVLAACDNGKGVYGTVTDGVTNKPLAGARVELLRCGATDCNEKAGNVTTGSDGRYSFPDATPAKYNLGIVWEDSPDCPGIVPFQTLSRGGEFVVAYSGYVSGGLGGNGARRIIATKDFELKEGQSSKLDITFACPK